MSEGFSFCAFFRGAGSGEDPKKENKKQEIISYHSEEPAVRKISQPRTPCPPTPLVPFPRTRPRANQINVTTPVAMICISREIE